MKKLLLCFLAANAVAMFMGSPLRAASHTWAGAGLSGYWSLPANWAGNNPPAVGEASPVNISFPAGAARLNNTNNLAGLVVDQLAFLGTGYTLNGSGGGTNITLRGGGGTALLGGANTTNTLAGSFNLILTNNVPITINAGGSIVADGILQGTGGFSKYGLGTLTLFANFADTYTGPTYVISGTLKIFCGSFISPQVAVPGYLEIGGGSGAATVQLLANSQLSTTATLKVNVNGVLDLNNFSATCGPLILDDMLLGNAPWISTGTGILTLNGNVGGSGGYINGVLSLGGVTRQFSTTNADLVVYGTIINGGAAAGIIKNGDGYVDLYNSNSFSGPVTINAGAISAHLPNSLGTGAGGVTVNNGGGLALINDNGAPLTISNVNLTLNGFGGVGDGALTSWGTNTWAGPINLASDSLVGGFQGTTNNWLYLNGQIFGPGKLQVGGTTYYNGYLTAVFTGSSDNIFSGALSVLGTNTLYLSKSSGATAVPGALNIGDATGDRYTTYVRLGAPNQIANSSQVATFNSGVLDLGNFNETLGALNFDGGYVDGNAGLLTLIGNVAVVGNGGEISCLLSLGGQTRTFDIHAGLSIYSQISDGGASAGLNLTGATWLELWASNSFSGPVVVGGSVELGLLDGSYQLGTGSAGLLLSNSASLYLVNELVSGKPLVIASTNASAAVSFGETNSWSGPITLAIPATIHNAWGSSDKLTLGGVISGNSALAFAGNATVVLSGPQDNTYSGITRVTGGKVILQKVAGHLAIPGNLEIGTAGGLPLTTVVQLAADNQINPGPVGYVQVDNSGWLNLNGHLQTIPQLYLVDNGSVDSAASGLLTLAGNVTVDASAVSPSPQINGNLSLGGANRMFSINNNVAQSSSSRLTINAKISDGIASAGFTSKTGRLDLMASNSFSGPVVDDHGALYLFNSKALGGTSSGLILTNGGSLITYASVTNEALTTVGPQVCGWASYGSNFWTGPIQLQTDAVITEVSSNFAFVASGPISGPANLSLTGVGTVRFTGLPANTLAGTITAGINNFELAKTNSTAVSGRLQITNGLTRLLTANQILDTSAVTVGPAGVFSLNSFTETIGDFSGAGSVNLGAGILTVGGSNPTNLFSGPIAGAGGELDKIGGNTLILAGANTYTSATMAKGGMLLINGLQPASDVYVLAGATLGGNGSIGPLHSTGGLISPGSSPGKLTVNGNAILDGTSKLLIEINGTVPGVGYDQLNDIGQLAANGATLQVAMNFSGAVSNQYVIVNHPSGLTSTIFNNLFEGDTVTASNGTQFRLSYVGGDGNDVVLTQLNVISNAPQIGGIHQLGNGTIQFTGTGSPNTTYTVQATTDLAAGGWAAIGTTTADGAGNWTFTDSQAPSFPTRFYRLVWP